MYDGSIWAGTKITKPEFRSIEVACATSENIVPPTITIIVNAANQQLAVFRNTDCPFCYVHAVAPLEVL